MPVRALQLVVCALLLAGCGASGSVDATTASYASTLSAACASGHDCAANQRCVSRRCELVANACVAHEQCGSGRCDAGLCALPSPALLFDETKTQRPEPRHYLRAGNDGLVDRRGGLVLALAPRLEARGGKLRWLDFELRNWTAHSDDPASWATTVTDAAAAPERFVFEHPESGAQLVAYVRPLAPQDLREPLSVHAARLRAALERGHTLADAVTLDTRTLEALPLERDRLEADRLEQLEAVRFEAQRRLSSGSDRLRIYLARFHFGTDEFVAYVGLSAPVDAYAELLDELGELVSAVRFGGVDARVGTGL